METSRQGEYLTIMSQVFTRMCLHQGTRHYFRCCMSGITRCAMVCLWWSPNPTSVRPWQKTWRLADPSCWRRTKLVSSCCGYLDNKTHVDETVDAFGYGVLKQILVILDFQQLQELFRSLYFLQLIASVLYLHGWGECPAPLWQQPFSVYHHCQWRIWWRGFL